MSTSRRGLPVETVVPLGRIGKAMARGMKDSVDTLALSQVSKEIDLSNVQNFRKMLKEKGSAVSINTFLMAAVARTLVEHRYLNAELQDDQIIVYAAVNLGMAVATTAGLIVVVIPGADKLSLDALGAAIEEKAGRARDGKIGLPDIEGGTFTVSNLGMYGVDSGTPIPRPPESAILLFGAIRPRPVVVEDSVVVRETCWATMSYDHRFIDGASAAEFLQALQDLLSDAEKLAA